MLPKSDHPNLDLIALALIFSIAMLGALSFFFQPAYQIGLYAIISALVLQLANIVGAINGLSQTKPPGSGLPGSSVTSHTDMTVNAGPTAGGAGSPGPSTNTGIPPLTSWPGSTS